MTDKHRTPVILISGMSPAPNRHLAERLSDSATAVVHHDLRQISTGVVLRTVRLGQRESRTALELAHGCASCTLREDVLPLLRRLSARPDVERIVLRLDEALEPERACWSIHHVLVDDRPVIDDIDIEAVATVVDAANCLDDAIGDDLMAERGLSAAPDDERTVAQVALAQIEFADVIVRTGAAPDPWAAATTDAVLTRVAPSAPIVELATISGDALLNVVGESTRHGVPDDPHGFLLRGRPPLNTDCGVTLVPFSARRPFHPRRLHEAIDVLLDGTVRTRGRAWVASQPDVALWIESAGGGLGIGHLGPWLDSPQAPDWADVSAERRTLAAVNWDPTFGDRHQEIVAITHGTEPNTIHTCLHAALLTDEELAAGPQAWARYPDPFADWHEDTELTDTVHNGRNQE